MKTKRDNFSQQVRTKVALRAAHRCSNPDCQKQTAGPSAESQDAVSILGDAAHICAAAPGGPRYDSTMSPEERSNIDNAIWLCANCARLIDRDTERYTPDVLRGWKTAHESSMADTLAGKSSRTQPDVQTVRPKSHASVVDEADVVERVKTTWVSQEYLIRESIKQARNKVREEYERRGTIGSGPYWSSEVDIVVTHLRRLVEACIDQLADDTHRIPAALRDESYWHHVEEVLTARSKQYLRGSIGALVSEAEKSGHKSSGMTLTFSLQENQAFDEIAKRIQTRTRELALRDRLSVSSRSASTDTTSQSVGDELVLDYGYCSHYFTTERDEETCVLENARVLVHAGVINRMPSQLLPIAEAVAKSRKPLLVIADAVTDDALSTLVTNKKRRTLHSCAIDIGSGDKARQLRREIARFTGATVIGDEAGLILGSATLSDLGMVARVVCEQHHTRLYRDKKAGMGSYKY